MDINAVKPPIDYRGSAYVAQTTLRTPPVVSVPTEKPVDIADQSITAPTDDKLSKKPLHIQEVTQMTEAMNKFIQAMDANIRFSVHEKSNKLIVQVVDQANNRVLKEFPPHQLLDTMAAISDYVGILLDEKM